MIRNIRNKIIIVLVFIAMTLSLWFSIQIKTYFVAENLINTFVKPTTLEELRLLDPKDLAKLNKFDSREYGIITPVRDQRDKPICWTYATIAASEASILRKGISNETKNTLKLSENNIAFTTGVRHGEQDPLGNTLDDSWEGEWLRGNYIPSAAQMLLQWFGPIDFGSFYGDAELGAPRFYLESFVRVDSNDRNAIKRAIAEYGAVAFDYYTYGDDYQYFNGKDDSKFGGGGTGHAATIVGWDDTISKDLFTYGRYSNPASSDGAWIVKNSWGEKYGIDGYFYLSYENPIANIIAFDYVNTNEYENNYYYDGRVLSGAVKLNNKDTAAIFEAKKSTIDKQELIKAINVGVNGLNVTITAKIYTGVSIDPYDIYSSKNNPTNGVLRETIEKTVEQSGSYTLRLKNPIKVEPGEFFSVVVTLSNPNNDVYIYTSDEPDSTNDLTYYRDGENWYNTKSYLKADNVARIKAFTITEDRQETVTNNISYAKVSIDKTKYRYGEEERNPKITVEYDGKILIENTHYKISKVEGFNPQEDVSSDNATVGNGQITIKGIGDYTGKRNIGYFIIIGYRPDVSLIGKYNEYFNKVTIEVDSNVKYYKDVILPTGWRWVYPEYKIEENKDEYIEYIADDALCYRRIMYPVILNKRLTETVKKDITKANLKLIGDKFIYNNSYLKPKITVELDGTILNEEADYILSYSNNKNVGQATISITGRDKYTGIKTINFNIEKAQNSVSNVNIINGKTTANATFGDVTFKYYSDSACTKEIQKPTKVGVYWVKAFVKETDNYLSTESKQTTKYVIEEVTSNITNDNNKNDTNTNIDSNKEKQNNNVQKTENKGKSNLVSLWIILDVLAILIAVIVIVIITRKRKNNKKESN